MTRLFIENREIELDESVQFAITKQFEDLSNPTTIINDWSKTVSIPFTTRNNAIFGHIYNPDKLTVEGSANQALTGIYFNPYKKLDMRLQWGDDVLMVGYAKMNEVKQNNGKGTYELTLFGQLGKLFQEMQKITFNVNDGNSDYIIDGSEYIDEVINKTLVVSSWTSDGQQYYQLYPKYFIPASGSSPVAHPAYRVTDIIGFAPNNSYYEEFDAKSYQSNTAEARMFTETLKTKWDDGNGGYVTGVEPSTAIPDGMLPRDIGEFRSYYQTPFIYWNKLWQIFQKKAELITGYNWDLDSDWFTSGNPYYSKLVYILKPFNVKNGTSLENHYTKWGKSAALDRSLGRSTTPGSPQKILKMAMPSGWDTVPTIKNEAYKLLMTYGDIGSPEYDNDYPHYPTDVAVFKCPQDFTSITFKWIYSLLIETPGSCHFKDDAGLIVSVKMYGCDDWQHPTVGARLVQTNNYIIRHEGSNFTYLDYTPIDTGTSPDENPGRWKLYPTFSSNFSASYAKCGAYCYFTIDVSYTASQPFYNENLGDFGYSYLQQSTSLDVLLSSGAFRTGVHFTLNDLWDNSYNLFEQILNYCKMYRILVFVDEVGKKLKFIRSSKYFQTYKISDWSSKLDLSKDYVITPVTFENKYVIFNYDDNKTKLGEKYKESWGVNYGDKRLITQYNFNEEKKNLFDKKITASITNTDFSLSWTNLYDYNKISYSLPAEIFTYSKDKNNKSVNNFGAFFFHNGKRNFDTTPALRMRSVSVSDDTSFQQSNDTYYYSQSQDGTTVTTYPALDVIYDNENLCLFNTPMENYTYAKNLGNSKGIYDMFWQNYIDERYNIQNKKVTCYLRLKPSDFINFEYNTFVKIGNLIYFINKIYDYDITSNESTKVDLLTIQDVSGYYMDYYSDYLEVSPSSITLDGSSGTTDITINAYQNAWNYRLLDGNGEVVSSTSEITLTKVNNTTLRVTKNGDYSLNYIIQIYTATRSNNVAVTGARSLYIEFIPTSVIVTKNATTEFDIRVLTNLEDVNMLATNTIQWYRSDTSQWKTTAFQAASYVPNWGSPEEGDTYNEAHEERDFTIHCRIVNPTASGNIMFFEHMPVSQYYYVPYIAIDGTIATLNSEGTAIQNEDNVEYHGTSSIRGYKVYSSYPWSCSLPQGVSSYGATSGDAGITNVTFDWGSGTPGTSKTITFTNTNSGTCSLVCHYVTE